MSAYSPVLAELIGAPISAEAQPWTARLAFAIAAPFRALARETHLRRTERALQALDDRTLADIGLRRAEISSVTSCVIDGSNLDLRRVPR